MAHPVQSIDDLWNKVSGSDQVDVVGACCCSSRKICASRSMLTSLPNVPALMVWFWQKMQPSGQPGKKIVPEPCSPLTQVPPKVQSGAGKLDRIAHTAATGEKAAVNAAVSWTEGTRV